MKHLNTKKTILILAALLAVCLLMTGCAGAADAVNAVKEAVSEASVPADSAEKADGTAAVTAAASSAAAVPAPRKQSGSEEFSAAFERMLEKGLAAAENNDFETFRTLYVNTGDEYLQSEWAGFKSTLASHDKHIARLLWQDGDRSVFGVTFYTVTGVHPNTRRTSNWYYLCMKLQDGEGYMFQPTQEELAALQAGTDESVTKICFDALGADADAARAARDAGRNFSLFAEPWLMTRSDICFEGCNESPRVMMAWQEENGDVKVLLWTANGTGQNITDFNIRVQMEDQKLGMVFDYTLSESIAVRAGHSVCRLITVPAAQVRTGTAAWGILQSHVSNNNQ